MRLYLNLIPALGYAVATIFSNMVGLTGEVSKSSRKQQVVASMPVARQEPESQKNCVLVAKNGQITLNNGEGNACMVWKIPYCPDAKCLN